MVYGEGSRVEVTDGSACGQGEDQQYIYIQVYMNAHVGSEPRTRSAMMWKLHKATDRSTSHLYNFSELTVE